MHELVRIQWTEFLMRLDELQENETFSIKDYVDVLVEALGEVSIRLEATQRALESLKQEK